MNLSGLGDLNIPLNISPNLSAAGSDAPNAPAPEFIDKHIKLSSLREEGKAELIDILQSLRGKKCLVLEPQLGGLLNIVIQEVSKTLKEHGVSYVRELRNEACDFMTDANVSDMPDNIVYIVRPNLMYMKMIAKHIKDYNKSGQGTRSQYHIYFVPHRTIICEQMLEDEGVLDLVEIGEFNLGMIPYENDLLSLEMDSVFKQCYIDGDTSSLNAVARSLSHLQSLYGIIPHIKIKGAASKKVLQKLLHLRREEELINQTFAAQRISLKHEIDTLVM